MATIDLTMIADTYLMDVSPTTNFNASNELGIGENNVAAQLCKSIIKPDFASIPVGVTITAATLKMTPIYDNSSNARTMYAHRVLRDTNFGQCTWNIWKTSNNWGTAGCSHATTDYSGGVVLGSATQPASPTLNSALSFTMSLDAAEITKFYNGTYTNNGIVLFVDTQSSDLIRYASTDHATSSYRPILTIDYTTPSTVGASLMMLLAAQG